VTLRKKTILIVGITLISLVLVMYLALTSILLESFDKVEETEVHDSTQRAVDTLNDQISSLNVSNRDWAGWDDTYAFIVDGNDGYIQSNLALDSSFLNLQVSLMMYVNTSGQIVYSREVDLNQKIEVPVTESVRRLAGDKILTTFPGPESSVAGIVMLPDGPMMISSQPILPNDRNGPIRGALLWGRYLDQSQVDDLAKITHLSLKLRPVDDQLPADFQNSHGSLSPDNPITIRPLDSDTIAGYTMINDIYDNPALLLRIDVPRTIYAQGQATMRYLIFSIMVVGLVFGAGTLLLLEKWVLSRTARLSGDMSDIAASGDHGARVMMDGKDELSSLAGGINNMLQALESSQEDLRRAHDELENRVQARTVELRDKVAVLQTLAEIDREVMGATRSQSILNLVCNRAAELLHAPKAVIALTSPNGQDQVAASVGLEDESSIEGEIPLYPHPDQMDNADHTHHDAFAINRITGEAPHMRTFRAREKVESLVFAPLVTDGQMLGAMLVFDTVPRDWNADEVQVLGLLSAQAAIALDEARLFEEEQSRRQELSVLYGLSRALADAPPEIDTILNLVTTNAVDTIHVTFAAVALTDESGECVLRAVHPVRALGDDLQAGDLQSAANHLFCRSDIERNEPVVVHDDVPYCNDHECGPLFPGLTHTLCLVPLLAGERSFGMLILGEARSEEREPFSPEKMRLARSIGDQTASALGRAEFFIQLEHSYLETVLSLANAVEAKDTYTADHAESLAAMALAIGGRLGLTDNELEDLRYGAILHDVGKIGIPDSLLQKPGKFNQQEWLLMKRHPDIGAQILMPVPRLAGAAQIVRHHHERFDGDGYPAGLAGEAIPIGARILAVADSYSAIVDKRVYKEAFTHEEAIAELKRCSGTQFDPMVLAIFLELVESGEFG
jgi:HD-GYP domain-containing protein (c-di-GMP phosphodiesterase class II)/sensor domain CHASE-containing protein